MTRPGNSPSGPGPADLFAADPDAAVIGVLQETKRALTAVEIKKALHSAGVAKADIGRSWSAVQKNLKDHPHVLAEGARYRWTDEPEQSPAVSATEALELLLNGKLTALRKAALADIVRAALTSAPDPEDVARQRQRQIDAVRTLADLAGVVEELIANEVDPPVLVRSVRAHVKRSALEPIERAGEETKFDRKLHKPIGRAIGDGAPVIVVRPGYIWKTPPRMY